MRGHSSVVAELLARGADVSAADKWGWCPLHWACEGGRLELVQNLTNATAPVGTRTKVR
jgi:ankyrin repeat protein